MPDNLENTIQTESASGNTGNGKAGFWKYIPRKIVGGLAAMWIVWKAAAELKDLPVYQFYFAIGCITMLGLCAIATHYLLERGPKLKKVKVFPLTKEEQENIIEDYLRNNGTFTTKIDEVSAKPYHPDLVETEKPKEIIPTGEPTP